ncbi:hypothetical protein [Kribbella deserti]|uniref:SH3 domain-containing protein n=1 Tax=Kribbella deserti TaxID=1926257 RepID=A0ABV6QV24_9ACTN
MNRLSKLTLAAVVAAVPAIHGGTVAEAAPAAETGAAIQCYAMPGGGWIHNARTTSAAPNRIGPYEACRNTGTIASGRTVALACWLYNDYNNLWYKTNSNTYIYSSHFSSSVKDRLSPCEG